MLLAIFRYQLYKIIVYILIVKKYNKILEKKNKRKMSFELL